MYTQVRLPRESTVADVLAELSKAMEQQPAAGASGASATAPNPAAGKPLRLMEVYNSRIYKVWRGGRGCIASGH